MQVVACFALELPSARSTNIILDFTNVLNKQSCTNKRYDSQKI